ncbi:structural protein VP4 [Saline Natrinema sp. J7-1 virus 1]|uniref:Structural protein VP4 n=1 Tax=Saline Natrinema sp. J7-1 virus 1 TaxID=2847285 RepID=A0AAE9VMF4_9VIRU|nr:structural protein VP4 [Saline Natrinema sp. J7-1 virus 1]WBE14024.1 structural protein VP4 [Saline Natrinema sp. J7-1 virus 1]
MSEETDTVNEDLETAEDTDESKPEIDDGATVDVDLEAVDEDLENDDETTDEDAPSSDENDAASAVMGEGETMGDYYVKGLCSVSNAVIENHGGEPISESVARDLDLDSAMDEFIRSKGGTEDLPPGQALAIGTTMFAMAVLATNPQIVNGLLEVLE